MWRIAICLYFISISLCAMDMPNKVIDNNHSNPETFYYLAFLPYEIQDYIASYLKTYWRETDEEFKDRFQKVDTTNNRNEVLCAHKYQIYAHEGDLKYSRTSFLDAPLCSVSECKSHSRINPQTVMGFLHQKTLQGIGQEKGTTKRYTFSPNNLALAYLTTNKTHYKNMYKANEKVEDDHSIGVITGFANDTLSRQEILLDRFKGKYGPLLWSTIVPFRGKKRLEIIDHMVNQGYSLLFLDINSWDFSLINPSPQKQLIFDKPFEYIATSDTGQWVALANHYQVYLFNTQDGSIKKVWEHPAPKRISEWWCNSIHGLAFNKQATVLGIRAIAFNAPFRLIEDVMVKCAEDEKPLSLEEYFRKTSVCKNWRQQCESLRLKQISSTIS